MVISENCCNFKVLKIKNLQTIIAMITEDKVTESSVLPFATGHDLWPVRRFLSFPLCLSYLYSFSKSQIVTLNVLLLIIVYKGSAFSL